MAFTSVGLVGYGLGMVGVSTDIHTAAKNPVLQRSFDGAGNEYIYLKGVASTVAGSWVAYDELGLTTLLVANGLGAVAIAQNSVVASNWGWYLIFGAGYGLCLVSYADNAKVWATSTAGSIDDADVPVDLITGAVGRSARATTGTYSGMALFQLNYPMALNEVYN